MPYTVAWDEILFFLFHAAVAIPALQAAGKLFRSGDILNIQKKTKTRLRLDRQYIFLGLLAGTDVQFVIAE
jgi:hypothetical protein